MLKKALTAATIAVTFFACSSSNDDDTPSSASKKPSSSSSEDITQPPEQSSSSEMVFTVLYDFEEDNDYTIGYVMGGATLGNDCAIDTETGECTTEVDEEGKPYLNWVPGGIFTLKDFSFNGETDLAVNGGGLILKNLSIKDYAAVKFKAKSTADGRHAFRIKASKDGKEAAIRNFFEPSTTSFETVTIEISVNSFQKDYNDTDLSDAEAVEYVLQNATQAEFLIPIGRFSPNTPETKHTLEIDDFEVAGK